MNRQNDENNRNNKQKYQMDIIKDLKKAGLKQEDIDYIINELNTIEKMIQDKNKNINE